MSAPRPADGEGRPSAPRPAGELFSLEGRTAIVTGASAGLGARFASVLAQAGATVFAAARRIDRLKELADSDARIHPVACDVAREADRTRLIETALTTTGRIDILVNNAATSGETRAEDESPDAFTDVLGVNLTAPFHLARLTAEVPAPASGGRSIINVSSILGLVSAAPLGGASYSASKAGLIGLTRELAGQWGRSGTRVNALAPGWFRTEMTEDLFGDERSSRWVERNTLLHRGGDGHELDGALLFLASDASSYCTGQVLTVDGGWTAR
ncbi:SDR family oxidoreductase [Streptomyces canus]|uniref:SDR family NAD(P)-dependent oxidoreductase n=1 Tax=Streptomyces canus TaxID=58343 RepID=UPI00225BAC40|nr:SDR family oxidoreductase [Streptomyces canus]MCX5254957.1 SDR family oxidoreductase [Streptomyces canus]